MNFVHKIFPVAEVTSLMLIPKSEIMGSKSKMFYKKIIPLILFEVSFSWFTRMHIYCTEFEELRSSKIKWKSCAFSAFRR